MRTAKVIMRHIHAVLVFLGDFVLEEGGQKQYRTDRRISGVIYLAAVVGGILGIFILAVAPGSCDVSKGSFHGKILSPGLSGQQKTAVYQPPAYIRSEERRVGKARSCRWGWEQYTNEGTK